MRRPVETPALIKQVTGGSWIITWTTLETNGTHLQTSLSHWILQLKWFAIFVFDMFQFCHMFRISKYIEFILFHFISEVPNLLRKHVRGRSHLATRSCVPSLPRVDARPTSFVLWISHASSPWFAYGRSVRNIYNTELHINLETVYTNSV